MDVNVQSLILDYDAMFAVIEFNLRQWNQTEIEFNDAQPAPATLALPLSLANTRLQFQYSINRWLASHCYLSELGGSQKLVESTLGV